MAAQLSIIGPRRKNWPLLWDSDDWDDTFPVFSQNNKMNIEETEKEFVVTIEAPEYNPDEIEVSFDDGILTVTGNQSKEKKIEKKNKQFIRVERTSSQFTRQWTPPSAVSEESINANLKDGLLTVRLEKSQETSKGVKVKVEKE